MKDILREYLQTARDAVVWKLEGLSAYDARRPLVPTGTNLLGLVKHLASCELAYFGPVFGRSTGELGPWLDRIAGDGIESGAAMFARADESRAQIVSVYREARAMSDATIEELDLEAPGMVSWWGDAQVTLGRIMVHVTTETCRHAGHADFGRELIDGTVGYATWGSNIHDHDPTWWPSFRDRVEEVARNATD